MGNLLMLPILALTDARTLLIAGGIDIVEFSAMALMLVLLTARILEGGFFKSRTQRTSKNKYAGERFFESKRLPALKPCPNCVEKLPISAIICHGCDYNFLAERPGRGQRLLPAPQPIAQEASK